MAYKVIKGKNRITGSQTFIDTLSGSIISASYFVGDGSLLTNVTGAATTGSATGQGPEKSVQFKSGSSGQISGSSDLLFDYTIPKFTVNSGFVVKRTTTSGNLTISSAQYIIGVDTANATASITLSLPNASTLSDGQMFVIKDEGGMADSRTITISCSTSGQTIDGDAIILIESPHSAINIYSNGLNKYFIYWDLTYYLLLSTHNHILFLIMVCVFFL